MPISPERLSDDLFLLPKERRQVRERVSGRSPLFVMRADQIEKVANTRSLPGSLVRISPEGDIFFPVWRERSWVNKPELYVPCSSLPRGWTFERLLGSKRRPISEIVWYQVRKDDGSVWAAIRSMNHVLEGYQEEGREYEQLTQLEVQVGKVVERLQAGAVVSPEEFEEGFENFYHQTLRLMENLGLGRAKLVLKKDIERLVTQASRGKDRLGRRNMLVMMKKLEGATRRLVYRRNETEFIQEKFSLMRGTLIDTAKRDEKIFLEAKHDLTIGFAAHEVFKFPDRTTTPAQKGILIGMIGTLVYRLERIRVKPFKPAAKEAIGKLKEAQELVKKEEYGQVKVLFNQALGIFEREQSTTTSSG